MSGFLIPATAGRSAVPIAIRIAGFLGRSHFRTAIAALAVGFGFDAVGEGVGGGGERAGAAGGGGGLGARVDGGFEQGGFALDDAEAAFDAVVGGAVAVEGGDFAVVELRGGEG